MARMWGKKSYPKQLGIEILSFEPSQNTCLGVSFFLNRECIISEEQKQKNPLYLFIPITFFFCLAQGGSWIITPPLQVVFLMYGKVLCLLPASYDAGIKKNQSPLIKVKRLSMTTWPPCSPLDQTQLYIWDHGVQVKQYESAYLILGKAQNGTERGVEE